MASISPSGRPSHPFAVSRFRPKSARRSKRTELQAFAATMRALRAEVGVEQGAMAARLGTSTRTLSDWENGYSTPLAGHELAFVYAIAEFAPDWTEKLAGLLGVADHPALAPLLAPAEADAPPAEADVAPAVAFAPAPAPAPPVPAPEPPRPSPEELRAALDAVVRDAADAVDVRASDLRRGLHAVLLAIAEKGMSNDEALAALAGSEVRRQKRAR